MTSGQQPTARTRHPEPGPTRTTDRDRLRGIIWPPRPLRHPRRARLVRAQEFAIVGIFVAICVALSIASPAFLTVQNVRNLLDQNAATGIIACGETLVIISGSFDLSVGAIYALAALIAVMLTGRIGPAGAIIVAVVSGLVLGCLNGVAVVFGRIHSFIATLATQYVFNGLALVISGGLIIQATAPGFLTLGQGRSLGINDTIWTFAGVAVVTGLLLTRTTWGRHVFAVGGNAEAARLSGIRVGFIRGSVFAISGAAAALAGVIAASRVGNAQAGIGSGLELAGIATTVLGGTSIFGGEGAIWRTILGVLLIGVIGNGFDLLGVSATYQQIVEGLLIIMAVTADAYSRLRR